MVEILLSLMCGDRMAEIGEQSGGKRRAAATPIVSVQCRASWHRFPDAHPTAGTALHGSVMTCAWRWRVAIGVAVRHLLLEESAHTT